MTEPRPLRIKIKIPALPTHTQHGNKIAWDRAETEPCQASTPGCCVDHQPGDGDSGCETW